MIVKATSGYVKSLDKLKNPLVEKNAIKAYENIVSAKSISDIKNHKKMVGHTNAYRIKIGDYRIGIFITGQTVTLETIAHRKDIYKRFP